MPNVTRIEREQPAGATPKLFDWKLGYALLGDRRVPFRSKAAAFAISVIVVAIVGILELPVEELVAVAIPFVGIVGDVTLDAIEIVVGPILGTCLLLPHLAPARIVEQVRHERGAVKRSSDGPIIDV